jgi:hypothetical protein
MKRRLDARTKQPTRSGSWPRPSRKPGRALRGQSDRPQIERRAGRQHGADREGLNAAVHRYSGMTLGDIVSSRFAHKAIEKAPTD